MSLNKFAAFATLALLLAGCASAPPTINVSASQLSAFSHRAPITVTQRPPPMMPMRASSAAFGALGGLAMASAAQSYAREHGVVDPASHIEDRLAALLQSRYGLQAPAERLDLSAVTEETAYPVNSSAVYVDAKTYMWMQAYFPGNWGRFRIYYSTLIQLIDGATGTAVAQYDCRKISHDSADAAPTLEELGANNSALANQLLVTMADACAVEFETTALGAVT